MVLFIEKIIDNKYAYVNCQSGDVFFDLGKYEKTHRYPFLSSQHTTSEHFSGLPADAKIQKRSLRDFVLWKARKPGEPSWKSPWGLGRPGWHIECTAMIQYLLGAQAIGI